MTDELKFDSREHYDYLDVTDPYNSTHSERNESRMESNIQVLDSRHQGQVDDSEVAEVTDQEWMSEKKNVIKLTNELEKRRRNYSTYKKSIETSAVLYNRERHKTFVLGVANVIAFCGCAYVWLSE